MGAVARNCSATPADNGTSAVRAGGGSGGTTTGPSEGGGMNGVVPPLASTESPTFAEPVLMAAMIGSDDMVASMTTITVYRLVGPAKPAARCTPATRRSATCVPPARRWRTSSGTGQSPGSSTTEAPLRQVLTQGGPSRHTAPPSVSVSMCQLSGTIRLIPSPASDLMHCQRVDQQCGETPLPGRSLETAAGFEVAL
ncbi:hypothetical protein Pflav_069080 [Phytohabitans flavus]|uniref:Uncharacterized protein n=1 Tax=Phytohabitans flavus TaxID=1076124 RepID=A0A6F8Y3E6_9ACTN|nr:hypothetical protein Pflav_069080 [Phytohabitans flavus]